MHKPCTMSGVYHTYMLANGCIVSQSCTELVSRLVSKHAIFSHIDLHIHLDIRLSKTRLPSR